LFLTILGYALPSHLAIILTPLHRLFHIAKRRQISLQVSRPIWEPWQANKVSMPRTNKKCLQLHSPSHAKTTSRGVVHEVSNLRFKIASSTSLYRALPLLYFTSGQSPDWTTPAVTTIPGGSVRQCYTSPFNPSSSAFVCGPQSILILYYVIIDAQKTSVSSQQLL
jgi:hypothetical protein